MSGPVHFMDVVPEVRPNTPRPELTDVFGRTWTWLSGELYRHDCMTWTKDMVLSPNLRGPSQHALANLNDRWCDRCIEVAQP